MTSTATDMPSSPTISSVDYGSTASTPAAAMTPDEPQHAQGGQLPASETIGLVAAAASEEYSTGSDEPGSPETHATEDAVNDDGGDADDDDEENVEVSRLTSRLRLIFAIITWPIVPLGTLAALALGYLTYTNFFTDTDQVCAHPLKAYATTSLTLALYVRYHARLRHLLSRRHNNNNADTTQRPASVRRLDQIFHTIVLLYVYAGITLVQTCQEEDDMMMEDPNAGTPTCDSTCPHVYGALRFYVGALEIFCLSLVLPLLSLPCLYLWFLQRASVEADMLMDQWRREMANGSSSNNLTVRVAEILDRLRPVRLVKDEADAEVTEVSGDGAEGDSSSTWWLLPFGSQDRDKAQRVSATLECCICMEGFDHTTWPHLQQEDIADEEMALLNRSSDVDSTTMMVQTDSCGHLFHRDCITSWITGGHEWQEQEGRSSSWENRRARRSTCPLCRTNLKPAEEE